MFQRCFELQKAVLSYCKSCLLEYKSFLLHVADSGLFTEQYIRRTAAAPTFCEEQKALLLMVKLIHKRSGHTGLVRFSRGAEAAYTIRENVCRTARATDSGKVIN